MTTFLPVTITRRVVSVGGTLHMRLQRDQFPNGRCIAWAYPDIDGWTVRVLYGRNKNTETPAADREQAESLMWRLTDGAERL